MESALIFLFLLVVAFINVSAVRAGRTGISASHNQAFTSDLLGLVMLSITLFSTVFWAAGVVLMELSEKGSSYTSPPGLAMIATALVTLAVTIVSLSSTYRCNRSNKNAEVA